MQLPTAKLDEVALFFDFDGTLVEIAPTPEAVVVLPDTQKLLSALHSRTGGATAIVTGRSLSSLDKLLQIAAFPASGSHGAQYRTPDSGVISVPPEHRPPKEFVDHCRQFAQQHQLIFEDKTYSITLHFRQQPDIETRLDQWLESLVNGHPQFVIQTGKCVREIKSRDIHKGRALDFFMGQQNFQHRVPWYFGDDVTDEAGFTWVNQNGGVSVKIGSGDTDAHHRLPDCTALHRFLDSWLNRS